MKRTAIEDTRICVIGLGYVGLPLARLFSTKYPTIGFDMNRQRVEALMAGHDATLEVSDELLQEAIGKHGFRCTADLDEVRGCNFYVVAVPTPVDENNRPDLKPLWGASKTVGEVISKGDVVVYESTVYPGVTEEECLPVVEQVSGLKFNVDFFAGYSPERINPGDKQHTVEKIKKVTSGSTPEIADYVDAVYNSVLVNGTHKDCISVDPYYLIQKAQVYGVLPRVMSNARRLNDGMGAYVANQTIKCMNKKGVLVKNARILLLGITFKENCPDIRNTKVVDIYHTLEEYTRRITVYDPWADKDHVMHEYGIDVTNELPQGPFDAVILAVAHREFQGLDVKALLKENGVIYDVKGFLDREIVDGRL